MLKKRVMLWILYALGSAVFHALGSIFDKKVMRHEHALEYGATKGVFFLFLVFALPFVRLDFAWQTYAALYGITIIFCAGNLYYLKSLRHSQISSAIPLMNISPLFLLIIAFVLLGETPSGMDVFGVFLLIAGTYGLQLAHSGKSFLAPFRLLVKSKYALYMVFAMVVFSVTATLEKGIINNGFDALSLLVIGRLMIGFNYIVLESAKHGFHEIIKDVRKDGRSTFFSALFGIISAAFYFLALATPGALVSLVIPVKRTSTMIAALVGGRLFHEDNILQKVIACVVMIAGVAIIAL